MAPQNVKDQLHTLSEAGVQVLREQRDRTMLSEPAQRLHNEHSKNLLEGAIAFWETSGEGQKLNSAFETAKDQLPNRITKVFAFGLPNLPDLPKDNEPLGFEDLDAAQRIPYLFHAAFLSLRNVLNALTDKNVEAELHSLEYSPTTERFLKSRQLHVYTCSNSPEYLDELASQVDVNTVVFGPTTDKYFKLYIKCKAKDWPAAVVWNVTENEGLDSQNWAIGAPKRWCSVYEMVLEYYHKAFSCAEKGDFGQYEVCIKKRDEGSGEKGGKGSGGAGQGRA